jgi:hypothetical protein
MRITLYGILNNSFDAEAIKRSLGGSGLRCTPQRYAVMAYSMEHNRHPTAAEIFEAVALIAGGQPCHAIRMKTSPLHLRPLR